MNSTNYITAEIYIKEDDIFERIINSFENAKYENSWGNDETDYKYENEKEIKKCVITINDKPISFGYFYKFKKKGKYKIKYSFSKKLTNLSYMFSDCNSLTNIDLSNFNTQNVKDMSYMFSSCKSLSNIDLSNINTENVKNMQDMFNGCQSLTNIDLSNFNTQNTTKISFMFFNCKLLTKENLITKDKNILYEFSH